MTAALIFAVTWTIRVPLPFLSGGYLNLGDAAIFVAAYLIGGRRAAVAAAVGSAFADLTVGAVVYMLPTAIIKGAAGLTAGAIARGGAFHRYLLACIAGGAVVTVGYGLFEWFYFDRFYAMTSLPFNVIQWAGGVIGAAACYALVRRFARG
jgi:uncharacterized membrane protein